MRLALLVCASLLALAPSGAAAAGTLTGTVVALSDGMPVAGATVTAAAPDQAPVDATTNPDGAFSLAVGGSGPYGVSVRAPGHAAQTVSGAQPGAPVAFALAPATFTPLPMYAATGASSGVVADARSGVFYALLNWAPEVYRSTDHGGTWAPLPMSYDDPDDGLLNTSATSNQIATSGVTGEVAVVDAALTFASYSTDYGVTWRRVAGPVFPAPGLTSGMNPIELYWGHAAPGADNVLIAVESLADGGHNVWRADMSAAAPQLVQVPGDPFGTGAVVHFADSASGSLVGRVSAAGALSFAPLRASGDIAFGEAQAGGLPAPPQLLRLGGREEASAAPSGALVAGGAPLQAKVLTKAAGAESFGSASPSDTVPVPDACEATQGRGASIDPRTLAENGSGNLAMCWFEKAGATLTLVSVPGAGIGEGSDLAFDADYGAGNRVFLSSQISMGPRKYATADGTGYPISPTTTLAGPGTAADSGGMALTGIVNPNVSDTDYGPAGASQLAVSAHTVAMASTDGGQTMVEVSTRGPMTEATQWWQGASGQWLVFGASNSVSCDEQLVAFLDWNGSDRVGEQNVAGSACAAFGGPAEGWRHTIGALAGVPGADTLFLAFATPPSDTSGMGNRLYRARLVPGTPPSLTDVVRIDTTLGQANGSAYCPASATFEGLRDVLFVASGRIGGSGNLLRVAAATGTPQPWVVASVPSDTNVSDVRADCTTGVVYAGVDAMPEQGGGVYKSTDGGLNFTRLTVPMIGGSGALGAITAIGLDPANPDNVTIAATNGGYLAHSDDGGTTWTSLNGTVGGRGAQVLDLEYPPPSARRQATLAQSLVGTQSGVFRAELSPSAGLIGVTVSSAASGRAGSRLTNVASDRGATVAVDPGTGLPTVVFDRRTGLFTTARTQAGTWSAAALIPGTIGADGQPVLARDPAAGTLVAAFRRGGARGGIHVTAQSGGSWSTPQRLTRLAGDTLPAIAAGPGGTFDVAFLRTTGRRRGVYRAAFRNGRWSAARRVRGTGRLDARPALGGPAIETFGGQVRLVFARGGRRGGLRYTTLGAKRWRALRRISRGRFDAQPALAIGAQGTNHVVFRRARGTGRRGLLFLIGRRTFRLRKIPGTIAADRQPSLSMAGSGLLLAFVRPAGPAAGIHLTATAADGNWARRPQRWSRAAGDRQPALRADASGRLALVFERR